MAALFFNLLVNSAFSLACGLIVVGFFIWLFRVQTGPWKLFLLSLPFVKIVFDTVRGLPANSILLHGIDPFSLPKNHQILQVGLGFDYYGPTLQAVLSVRNVDGQKFAASVGDYLAVWLTRKFGAEMLEAVLFLVCAISAMLILRRVYFGWKFESQRRKDRALSKSLHVEKLGSRYVDVYISKTLQGTPFTGGVFKPYICIPQPAFECLSNEELGAVIAHERAHIRYFDLPVTMVVQVLGDIYWFVPGYRWLSRKIDRMREVVADGWAVRSGIRPEYLASALVKLKELPQSDSKFILYSAFFREKSLLKIRVNTLLGESAEKESRFGWRLLWLRAVVSVSIFLTVMFTTFGGNQVDKSYRSSEWFLNLLKKAGWEVLSSDS